MVLNLLQTSRHEEWHKPGKPKQKGVIRGDLLAADKPISSTIAAA
jgi:hypothetical protein